MLNSWGNYPKLNAAEIIEMNWLDEDIPFLHSDKKFLAFGQGRSYGDCCLNENELLVSTKKLNRLINFDAQKGIIECEAGATLGEILDFVVPHSWFLPALPGTKFVSVGGAIANDVHGKNHHHAGTFGNHILSFVLLRSTGEKIFCSPECNRDLYAATIGGLGLTGIILSAKIQLKPVVSAAMEVEFFKFKNLEDFFELANNSDEKFEYTVAWLDCLASGKNFGRGIFMRANHAEEKKIWIAKKSGHLNIPFHFPSFTLNRLSVKLFNQIYFQAQSKKNKHTIHFDSFFFPLDAIKNWNRIYGKKGFVQYQCVLPDKNQMYALLKKIVSNGQGSFLSVLKMFGNNVSPGLLSFPMQGATLAIDLPYRGHKTKTFLSQLDSMVMQSGGRVYLAKDALMSAQAFKCYYPNGEQFAKFIDPKFSSSLWRRVNDDK